MVAFISACSSPKDANKENFKLALNGFLDRNCVLAQYSSLNPDFPITIKIDGLYSPSDNEKYEALVSVGLLDVRDGTEAFVSPFTNKEVSIPTKTYSLTDKGSKAFKKIDIKDINGFTLRSPKGFCAAALEVKEINSFTEPADRNGFKVSEVNYTVSQKNVSEWANNEKIMEAFKLLARDLQENNDQSSTLVLINDGWVHPNEK